MRGLKVLVLASIVCLAVSSVGTIYGGDIRKHTDDCVRAMEEAVFETQMNVNKEHLFDMEF